MTEEIKQTQETSEPQEQKRSRGRPRHVISAKNREIAWRMIACEYPHDIIAEKIGISESTFERVYKDEIKKGMQILNSRVMETLLKVATTVKHKAVVQAAGKWLAVKAGWRDPDSLAAAATAGVEIANNIIAKMNAENMSAEEAAKHYMDFSQRASIKIN